MIAISTPPPKPDDRDAQFINFQEEFRRSKRNSLIWSSLLLLISVARMPLDGDGEAVRIAGTAVLVPQQLLVIMLAIAALFFFLSYLRSLSVIVPLNSEAARNADELWADSEKIMKGIKRKISGPDESANQIIKEISNIKKHIEIVNSSASKLMNDLQPGLHDQNFKLAVENFKKALADKSPSIGGLQREGERLRQASLIRHQQVDLAIGNWQNEASEAKTHLKNFETYIDDRINNIEISISNIEDSLSKFRDAILGREKAWHWSLDRVAVMGLFAVSIGAAVGRARYPTQLDALVMSFV